MSPYTSLAISSNLYSFLYLLILVDSSALKEYPTIVISIHIISSLFLSYKFFKTETIRDLNWTVLMNLILTSPSTVLSGLQFKLVYHDKKISL